MASELIASDTPAAPVRRRNPVVALLDRHIAIASFIVLLIVTEIVTRLFNVQRFILPPPSEILWAVYSSFAKPLWSPAGFYPHLLATGVAAATSFVGGAVLGVASAFLVVRSPFSRRLLYPYVISLQSVPKVALAPLFTVWFGLGFESKVVLGILLTFFPVLINTAAGLAGVDRDRLELMKSMKATPWQTFRYVQLPSAWPFIFAGLELAAIYAMMGEVVAEFVGGDAGLGVLILNRNANFDIAGSMAALVVLAVIGILLQKGVSLIRRRVLFWAPTEETVGKG